MPGEGTRMSQRERQLSRDCGLRGADWEERIKPGRWVSKCLIIMGPE